MRISDWSSDVCSSDLQRGRIGIGHDAFLQAEIIRAAPRGAAGHWRRLYAGLANGARGRAGQTKETPRPALPTPPPARSFRHARPPASGRGRRRLRQGRSEEHTSELQSLMRISYADLCLKKKTTRPQTQQK